MSGRSDSAVSLLREVGRPAMASILCVSSSALLSDGIDQPENQSSTLACSLLRCSLTYQFVCCAEKRVNSQRKVKVTSDKCGWKSVNHRPQIRIRAKKALTKGYFNIMYGRMWNEKKEKRTR